MECQGGNTRLWSNKSATVLRRSAQPRAVVVLDHMLRLVVDVAQAQAAADPLKDMLTELALSTARLRQMADEAHALVEHVQHRPAVVSVKTGATDVKPS